MLQFFPHGGNGIFGIVQNGIGYGMPFILRFIGSSGKTRFISGFGIFSEIRTEEIFFQQFVPIGKVDQQDTAGQKGPAADHSADCTDQLTEDALLQFISLHTGCGEDLSDDSAGKNEVCHFFTAEAESAGIVGEHGGEKSEQQEQAAKDENFACDTPLYASFPGDAGPHSTEQRHQNERISCKTEEVKEALSQHCAEMADPVAGGLTAAAGKRNAICSGVGNHRQRCQ